MRSVLSFFAISHVKYEERTHFLKGEKVVFCVVLCTLHCHERIYAHILSISNFVVDNSRSMHDACIHY